MKTLDEILTAMQFAASIATGLGGPVASGANLAAYFLKIAQSAVQAHEAITGQPLDMTKLHEIQPVT